MDLKDFKEMCDNLVKAQKVLKNPNVLANMLMPNSTKKERKKVVAIVKKGIKDPEIAKMVKEGDQKGFYAKIQKIHDAN